MTQDVIYENVEVERSHSENVLMFVEFHHSNAGKTYKKEADPIFQYLCEEKRDFIINNVYELIKDKLSDGETSDQEDLVFTVDMSGFTDDEGFQFDELEEITAYVNWEIGDTKRDGDYFNTESFDFKKMDELSIELEVSVDNEDELDEIGVDPDFQEAVDQVISEVKWDLEAGGESGNTSYSNNGINYSISWSIN